MPLASFANAARGGSVLDRIANPPQVNLLGDYDAATRVAGNIYNLKDKQSDAAWGEALQQATDENGNVDYNKAQAIAAHNPFATQGMLRALPITSRLTGEQQENIRSNMTTVAHGATSLQMDASDANVNAVVGDLVSHGMPSAQAEQIRSHLLSMRLPNGDPDIVQRQQFASRAQLGAMDAVNAAGRVAGTTAGVDVGGEISPQTLRQGIPGYAAPSMTPAAGGVGKTLTPGDTFSMGIVYPATQADVDAGLAKEIGAPVHVPGPDVLKRYGYGKLLPPGAQFESPPATPPASGSVTDSKGNKVGPTNAPRLLKVPGGDNGSSSTVATPLPVPPVPPANPPPAAPSPAASAPAAAAPAAAPPNPAAAPTAPPGAPAAANPLYPPGVNVASANANFAPANIGPNALAPGATSAADAILQGMRTGVAGPSPVQTASSFSVGPGYQSEASGKATAASSADKLAADDKLAATYAATIFPQAQALSLLGRGMQTGPTTDMVNQWKGFARTMLGNVGITAFDSTKEYDELHKWLTQAVVGNPSAMGSDARLAETLAGNANTGIHQLASADMEKAGIALTRMQVAANAEWHSLSPDEQAQYGGSYNNFLREFNKNVDPRAFAWDMFNPEQRKTLAADFAKHDEAYAQKFLDTRDMARRHGLLDETRAMP